MKRFFVVLGGLLMLPAFAEVAPVFYDDVVEYSDDMIEPIENDDVEMNETTSAAPQKNVANRTSSNRSTSRAISAASNAASRADSGTRATAASIRNGQRVVNRGTVSRTTKTANTSRANVVQRGDASRKTVTARATQTNQPNTARISANNSIMSVGPSVKNSSDNRVKIVTTKDDGPLYIGTSGSSAGSSAATTGSRMASRRSTMRASTAPTTPVVTEEDISTTTSNLDAIAELTEYCKAQYAACMDNYCNVLDDNQGRCSCSKNLKNYQKVEETLAAATESFQDTVQKIKYIGLTTDQVTSLFAETEAELQMKSKSDSSQLKNSLDAIKKKIIDVSSSNSSANSSNVAFDLSGLLDFDLSSGFDLSSFLNMNSSANVSNQRGEELFKTATSRCKTAVLNACTAQGIESTMITNSYDLEIDKQCIAYERSLNDANDEMRANVRNATTILQQARLMLAQNRNSYDLRSCVAAIDSCMQDEYVCGSDYELCLDPTGKYLAAGDVVKGGTPGIAGGTAVNTTTITNGNDVNTWTSQGMYDLYATWNYEDGSLNAWGGGSSETLGAYVDEKLNAWGEGNTYKTSAATNDMATYILQKVGYIDSSNNDKVHGMCAAAMKQCQDYAFKNPSRSNKSYDPKNEVVRQYLLSALTKIKLKQDEILSDYAEDCRSDVSSCLATNGYDETNTATTASTTAVNACRAEIVTCMSVSGQRPSDAGGLTLRMMRDWVASMLLVCPANYYLYDTGTNTGNDGVTCKPCGTLNGGVQLVSSGGQSTLCYCPDGYTATGTGANGHPTGCRQNQ